MSVSHWATHASTSVSLVLSAIFCKLKNEGSWGAAHLHQILFQIGKKFTETFQMLQQAYGEDCLSRTQCYEWYQHFKSGRTSIKDDPKSGRPSTSVDDDHIEIMLAVILQNRCLAVREVAKEIGLCKSSCHLILTDKLKIRHVATKFMPRLLMRHSFSMNFWQSMRWLLSPSRPNLQIWPLQTFSCSQSGNPH